MANHAIAVELFYGGAWHTVPAYARDGMTLSRGAPGEGQDAPPSSATLTLNNQSGDYNPRNVTGPLYGAVGRNTPLRVSADGSVRSTTEVASWGPERAIKGDAWTKVQGGGILRRLQQGKTPLRAPLERAILAAGPVAYWPANEGTDATQIASGIGGEPFTLGGIRPGLIAGPAGTVGSFPNLAPVDGVRGSGVTAAPAGLTSAGWGMECIVYIGAPIDAGASSNITLLQWGMTGTEYWSFGVGVDVGDGPYVIMLGDIGTSNASLVVADGVSFGWHHVRIVAADAGANVDMELWLDGVLVDTRTVVGVTLGKPAGLLWMGLPASMEGGLENTETAGVGMVAFYPLAGAVDHYDAYTGHAGEAAGVRFLRVLGEEGVPAAVIGDESDTQPMGSQPVETLLAIVRECVRTDDGLLFEPRDARGLTMRTGRDRYNQTTAATLDFAGGYLSSGLVPVQDDQATRNDVTVARRGGGSARAVRETGPMNVSDPVDDPQGVGRVDTQIDVNTATDAVLPAHAAWHLAKGTIDEPRYPNIVVDLDANPAMAAVVDALEIGDRFELENLPDDWQPGTALLLLLGVREIYPAAAGNFRRLVALNSGPASVYEVGIVGANDGSTDLRGAAVSTDLATLASGITTTATALSVASTGGVLWTTSAADRNTGLNGAGEFGGGLFIVIGGEVMRVSNLTGASSPQAFTVVRSVNGVVKTHSAGAPVQVYQPIRVAL
jgi:hypothetical protein